MYHFTTLKNGLKVITAPMKGTKTATVLVMVGTGSKYEKKEESGLSHFLEHMFFKGTKRRPTTLALSSELDAIGAEFNAFTGKEYTGYWVKAGAAKMGLSLDVVYDMLANSKFEAAEIKREKGVIVEEINMYQDNPMLYIEDVFEACLYGDTPAGRDTAGTKENVRRFEREDFLRYFDNQYGLGNTYVVLAGNLGNTETKYASSLLQKYFTAPSLVGRGRNFREKEAVTERQAKPRSLVHFKKTDQAHFSLGVRAYGYGHKDRAAVKLLSLILGGSMSSRLFISLRERLGLAYYVRTETETYTDTGYVTTRAGVPVDKLDQAVGVVLKEYQAVKEKAVGAAELKRTKEMLNGRSAIQFEASDNLANYYGRQIAMTEAVRRATGRKISLDTPEKYLSEIKAVTSADLRRVAREIFTDNKLNLAVIGPYHDGKSFEKILSI